MFATGIECSCPTIDGGRWRIDQLDATDHYRYGCRDGAGAGTRPWILALWPASASDAARSRRYDWGFMDQVARVMQDLDGVPIIDLCHFGVPDWLETFQNRELL